MKLIIILKHEDKNVLNSELEVRDIQDAINSLKATIKACEAILKSIKQKGLNIAKVIVDDLD